MSISVVLNTKVIFEYNDKGDVRIERYWEVQYKKWLKLNNFAIQALSTIDKKNLIANKSCFGS